MDRLVLFILQHGKCKEFNPYATIKLYYFQYILKKNKQLLTVKYKKNNTITRESLIELVLKEKLKLSKLDYDLIYWKRYDNYPIYAIRIKNSFPLNDEFLKEINNDMFLKTTIFPLYNKKMNLIEEIKEHYNEQLTLKDDIYDRYLLHCGDIIVFCEKKIYTGKQIR